MRCSSLPVVYAVLALAAAPAAGQTLAERVARAPGDQDVSFEFPAREDVCGHGEAVIRFHDDSRRGYSVMYWRGRSDEVAELDREELRRRCEFGPVRVTLARTGGEVQQVRVRVGGAVPAEVSSLGAVSVEEASEYLVGLARTAPRRTANDALSALLIAEGEYWPAMLRLARDRTVSSEVRKTALFWLGQAAGERATAGLRSILGDDSEEIEIRRSAVFALSQQRGEEAVSTLLEIAESAREPELRKHALFWLGQRDDDPRVIALFEKILLGKSR